MSRVIVNSGHPVAKLSFSDERGTSTDMLQRACIKLEKKERKREINLICRELFHCIHVKVISMFTHNNENAVIDLFILQDLFRCLMHETHHVFLSVNFSITTVTIKIINLGEPRDVITSRNQCHVLHRLNMYIFS